jgi:hypothetical protein
MSVCIQYETTFVQWLDEAHYISVSGGAAAIQTKCRQDTIRSVNVLTRIEKSCVLDASGGVLRVQKRPFPDNLSEAMEFAHAVRKNA